MAYPRKDPDAKIEDRRLRRGLVLPDGFDPSRPLPNPAHERFCIGYAIKQQSQGDAYRLAGYKCLNAASYRNAAQQLRDRPDVTQRLLWLEENREAVSLAEKAAESAVHAPASPEWIINKRVEAVAVAEQKGDLGALDKHLGALEAIKGMRVQKVETVSRVETVTQMTLPDIMAMLAIIRQVSKAAPVIEHQPDLTVLTLSDDAAVPVEADGDA